MLALPFDQFPQRTVDVRVDALQLHPHGQLKLALQDKLSPFLPSGCPPFTLENQVPSSF